MPGLTYAVLCLRAPVIGVFVCFAFTRTLTEGCATAASADCTVRFAQLWIVAYLSLGLGWRASQAVWHGDSRESQLVSRNWQVALHARSGSSSILAALSAAVAAYHTAGSDVCVCSLLCSLQVLRSCCVPAAFSFVLHFVPNPSHVFDCRANHHQIDHHAAGVVGS